jgi:hypothetical protein
MIILGLMPLKASYTEQAGHPGFHSRQYKFLLLSTASRPRLWDTSSPISNNYRGSFPVGKEQRRAEVKKSRAIPPLLHMSLRNNA